MLPYVDGDHGGGPHLLFRAGPGCGGSWLRQVS